MRCWIATLLALAGCNDLLDIEEPQEAACGLGFSGFSPPVSAGDAVQYHATVHNSSAIAAESVLAILTVPEGLTVTQVTASGGSTCTFDGRLVTCNRSRLGAFDLFMFDAVTTVPQQGGNLVAIGEVAATLVGGKPCSNGSSFGTAVEDNADVAVGITYSPMPALYGQPMSYTVDVHNLGFGGASEVRVQLTSTSLTAMSISGAGWTCTASGCASNALLASGAAQPLTVIATPSAMFGVTLKAVVVASTPDPMPSNNIAVANTTVVSVADLSLAMTAAPDPVASGSPLTYTLAVHNDGPGDAIAVSVVDTLPGGFTYDSFGGDSGWSCSLMTGQVTCTRVSIGPGSTSTLTLTGHAATGPLTNTATASAMTSADLVPGNNTASVTTAVAP
jgi:large repetitive protein